MLLELRLLCFWGWFFAYRYGRMVTKLVGGDLGFVFDFQDVMTLVLGLPL